MVMWPEISRDFDLDVICENKQEKLRQGRTKILKSTGIFVNIAYFHILSTDSKRVSHAHSNGTTFIEIGDKKIFVSRSRFVNVMRVVRVVSYFWLN